MLAFAIRSDTFPSRKGKKRLPACLVFSLNFLIFSLKFEWVRKKFLMLFCYYTHFYNDDILNGGGWEHTHQIEMRKRREVEQFQLSEMRDMNVLQLNINFISWKKNGNNWLTLMACKKDENHFLRLSFARQQVHSFLLTLHSDFALFKSQLEICFI